MTRQSDEYSKRKLSDSLKVSDSDNGGKFHFHVIKQGKPYFFLDRDRIFC